MKRFLCLVLVLIGCAKSSSTQPTTPVADPVPMREGASAPAAAAPELTAMLDAYEGVRVALAADDAGALPGASQLLEAHAQTATAKATPATAPHLSQIHSHAKHLAGTKDLTEARAAFGEVSRHVVALLVVDKSLAHGKHVFECPMVSGYRKWVQKTDNLENPYMGQQMLACGGASQWE